jgi:hypothetical protein
MIALVAARTNHRTTDHIVCTGRLFQIELTKLHMVGCRCSSATDLCRKFIVGHPSFVSCKFHFFCGTAVSCICITQTTAFSCYRFHFIYMHAWCFMQLRKTQRSMAVWECYCSFHFVVEVKVSSIFVEHDTTFRYAYHFIRKCCVLHIYLTIVVGNGRCLLKMLRRRVHVTAQARNRKTLRFPRNQERYVHKNMEHMWPLIHVTCNPCQTEFINLHILLWSLNVVSCITIRAAFFSLYSFRIWRIQNSGFN